MQSIIRFVALLHCGWLLFNLLSQCTAQTISITPRSRDVGRHNQNAAGNNEGRIVGGEAAQRAYPYQISLQVKVPVYIAVLHSRDWQHNCGGSLVTRRHVVTAAHCLDGYNRTRLSILAGTNQLNGRDGTRMLVEDYRIHPDYVELNRSDIGIMTTKGHGFVFGSKVFTNAV